MPENDVARKLLLKPGTSFLLLNAPADYGSAIADVSTDVEAATNAAGRTFDLVQLFVRSKAELGESLNSALAAVTPGGLFWLTYPKQTGAIKSDLNRDRIRESLDSTGWRPVTQISIDDTWSALRLRPVDEVGK